MKLDEHQQPAEPKLPRIQVTSAGTITHLSCVFCGLLRHTHDLAFAPEPECEVPCEAQVRARA